MAILFYFIENGKLQNVINGKHYNNAMGIYKIFYFAITCWRIQSFEDCLRNEDCEKFMEDFYISKEFNNDDRDSEEEDMDIENLENDYVLDK